MRIEGALTLRLRYEETQHEQKELTLEKTRIGIANTVGISYFSFTVRNDKSQMFTKHAVLGER